MNIVVIGCGQMGAGLAQTLSLWNHTVAVVDRDATAFERLGPAFKGQIIEGIGFDRDVLLRAGIERTDGLAAVTDSDETNIVTAHLARRMFHVPNVVARIHNPRHADVCHRLGLQTITPITWGINRIADLLCHSQLNAVLSLGEMSVVEVEIPPLLVGRTANELVIPGEVTVVGITRSGKSFLPAPGTVFQPGDKVLLAVTGTATERLTTMLELA